MSDRLRELLLCELNGRARDVFEGHRKARSDCRLFAHRKLHLVAMVKELEITSDEAGTHLRIICDDETNPKDDEYSQLIETAIAFVNSEYEKGKHNGRDAKAFFQTLFGRVSDELLVRLDESL